LPGLSAASNDGGGDYAIAGETRAVLSNDVVVARRRAREPR